MELKTRCPRCDTVFPISVEQLQRRRGYVRCGQCAHIFDGFEAVLDEPAAPDEPSMALPAFAAPVPDPVDVVESNQLAASVPASAPVLMPRAAPEPVNLQDLSAGWQVQELSRHAPPRTDPEPHELVIRRRPAFTAAPPVLAEPMAVTHETPAQASSPVLHSPEPFVWQQDDSPALPSVSAIPPEASPDLEPYLPPLITRPSPQEPTVIRARGQAQFSMPIRVEPNLSSRVQDDDEPCIGVEPPELLYETEQSASYSQQDEPPGDDRQRNELDWVLPGDSSRISETVYVGEPTFWQRLMRWGLMLLCVLGLILAAVQLVYIYRVQIASHVPAVRPALEYACTHLSCQVPYERRLGDVAISGSAFQTSASDKGQANLSFTLRNRFVRALEWPALTLELKDVSGALLARRNILPPAYLDAKTLAQPFPAHSDIAVKVPVQVGDLHVNGYQLSLYFP